jgi:hypothetical protein
LDILIHADSLLFGILIGFVGTLIGTGGGFLFVPYFLLHHGLSPAMAAGSSLVCTLINASTGSFFYWRAKRIDFYTALRMGLVTVPFAAFGATLTDIIPTNIFKIFFALLLLALAWQTFRLKEIEIDPPRINYHEEVININLVDQKGTHYHYKFIMRNALIIAASVGFLSTLIGIGGGVILVPLMIRFLNIPAHVSTATSQLIVLFTATFGAISHSLLGHLNMELVLMTALGIIIGSPLGVKVSAVVKSKTLTRFFSIILLYIAWKLLH